MSTEAVNWLNSGLMLATCVAAFIAPFHLFLFAYAVLGPLHYTTQISWMHDRRYFAARANARQWWLLLVGLTMLVLVYGFVSNDLMDRPVPPTFEIALVYLVLATAAMVLYVRHSTGSVVLIVAAIAAIVWLRDTRIFFLFAFFLVTILHVTFTAAFVLYGALKSKSRSGVVSLAVFMLCSVSFFAYMPPGQAPPESLRRVYAFFEPLNIQLAAFFGLPRGSVYESISGFAVMRLIAFAYTYYSLNLVFEDLDHQVARRVPCARDWNRRALDRCGRALLRELRGWSGSPLRGELPARAARIPSRHSDTGGHRARAAGSWPAPQNASRGLSRRASVDVRPDRILLSSSA